LINFNYYSSAISVSFNEVLITGGGQSKEAFLVQFDKNGSLRLKKKSYMNEGRKEHSSIYLDSKVYVLGG
jgi:hypothetical protein